MKEEFEKELSELSPFLADLKKQQIKEPFRTPKFYFDSLADRVLEQAKGKPQLAPPPPQYKAVVTTKNRLSNWLSTLFEPRMALASALLLAIVAWYFIGRDTEKAILPQTEVSTEDIKIYIEENIEDFDEHLIAEHLEKKAKNSAPNAVHTEGGDKVETSEFTEEELEEYLRENLDGSDLDLK